VQLSHFVILPIAVLFAGAALQAACSRLLSARAKGWLAFATSLVSLAAVLALWPSTYHGHALDLRLSGWSGPLALTFHVDGLAQLFALMGAGIGAAVLLYSIGYMADDRAATRFYVLMQIFIAGLIAFVYASNLLLMYAGWELIGLCSFMLVGFWYTQREAAAGARKVLVMTHIAGYALLAAILILFARTGTTVWTDPRIGPAFTTGIFALMLIAALAKSVQFPLHTWIPSAMAAPTPVSALLHAACYVKAGVYLVARMHSFAPWPAGWQTSVVWIGTVTMLIGVLFAMVQHDAKRMLAFSTVSQIGYMILGLGLGTPLGVIAGLLHCLNHGLFKGGLFLGAGAIQHATGTRDMDELGGLGRRMPRTTVLWLVGSASIAGVPLFNGFVSKWLIYVAALRAGFAVPALISWVVSVFTIFLFMKASSSMFFGQETEAGARAHEAPRTMLAGGAILATLCIVLGVAPQLAVKYVVEPALGGMGLSPDLRLSWLGLAVAGGSWYATAGLVLALLALAGGALVYWLASRRSRAGAEVAIVQGAGATPIHAGPATTGELGTAVLATAGPPGRVLTALGPAGGALSPLGRVGAGAGAAPFTGGEPLSPGGRLRASDFSISLSLALAPFYKWADPDRYYLAVWRATLALCARVARFGAWLERHALVALPLLALAVAAIGGAAAGVSRHAGAGAAPVAHWPLLGAAGLALVCLLLAGAADAALRRSLWLVALTGVLALAAFAAGGELTRLLALEAASLAAFLLLLATGVGRQVRNVYLLAVVLSAAAIVAGTLLLDGGPAAVVLALLLGGFAAKLALVPAYLWLPRVAERTPAPLVAVILAVVDAAALAELFTLRHSAAWLFQPAWPWLALGLLSAVGGAGLALAQLDVKRLLAFSSVTDTGFVVLAVTLAGRFGLSGAVVAAAAGVLAKSLLFAALAGPEREGPVTLVARGLAVRHPLAAVAFIAGALTALGVPPTIGYAGHWRIYETAYGGSWVYLALLVIATALSVLAYARVIAVCWWGALETEDAPMTGAAPDSAAPTFPTTPTGPWRSVWRTEAAPLTVALVVLTVVVLAAGVWPRAW
jgi:multicomponent K+:H+ antiporter subunit A